MQKVEPVRFGDYLVERKLIDEGQLLDALADHWMTGRKIGETLTLKGYLRPDELDQPAANP